MEIENGFGPAAERVCTALWSPPETDLGAFSRHTRQSGAAATSAAVISLFFPLLFRCYLAAAKSRKRSLFNALSIGAVGLIKIFRATKAR